MADSLVMVDLALKASTADHSERERERERAKTKTNVFTIKKEAVLFQEQTMPRSRESYNKMSLDFTSEQYIYGTRMSSQQHVKMVEATFKPNDISSLYGNVW